MYLSELSRLPGVSGDEWAVRRYIKNIIEPLCDRVEIDAMGNLLAYKKGKKDCNKTIMLCAHMDEVGLIVSRITDEGFLKFKTVGGIDPRVLVSKRVFVGKENLPGIIGRKAIHLLTAEERKQAPKTKNLYIDIGAKDKEEAEKLVKIGDYVTFHSPYREFGNGFIKSKALDDRAGCAILLSLAECEYDTNVYFAFTVQEEVGLRGARVCAKKIKPDLAIVFEATTCSDIPETAENFVSTRMGGGAALSLVDGATSYRRDLVANVYEMAKSVSLPVQFKQTATGGNDAGAIHIVGGGVPTIAVSIPARYIHSPSSVICFKDYEAAKQIGKLILKEADHV